MGNLIELKKSNQSIYHWVDDIYKNRDVNLGYIHELTKRIINHLRWNPLNVKEDRDIILFLLKELVFLPNGQLSHELTYSVVTEKKTWIITASGQESLLSQIKEISTFSRIYQIRKATLTDYMDISILNRKDTLLDYVRIEKFSE